MLHSILIGVLWTSDVIEHYVNNYSVFYLMSFTEILHLGIIFSMYVIHAGKLSLLILNNPTNDRGTRGTRSLW